MSHPTVTKSQGKPSVKYPPARKVFSASQRPDLIHHDSVLNSYYIGDFPVRSDQISCVIGLKRARHHYWISKMHIKLYQYIISDTNERF